MLRHPASYAAIGGRQTGRAAADDDNVIFHFACTSPMESLFVPVMSRDCPPHLVISLCSTCQLPRQDLHHARAAEARLAAAHARAGAALDTVQALCAERTVDGVEDLALRDLLTAADDLAVGGLFADELPISSWKASSG